MTIVIVGPAHPLRGGIADTNESFARALQALGHQVHLFTFSLQYPNFLFPGKTQFSPDPKPADLNIQVTINSIHPINWVGSAKKIKKLKPEMVIFRFWLPFMAPSLGSIARLLHKSTKKIAFCDNIIPHEKRIGDMSLTRYFCSAFDGFITMSKTVNNELEQFSSKPKINIPHPINDSLGSAISKKTAREKLGLDTNGKYVLFFGIVRQYKGLDLLLKAFATEKVKQQHLKLLVVGEFYDPIEEYQSLIDDLGIGDVVDIRNLYVPTADIKTYFSAANLVAQTYHTASQSGVTQMAYNFDCPILVTNVGGLAEVVPHKKAGYVCEKTPENIAEHLSDFFENNREDAFRSVVQEEKKKYSWKAFAEEVLAMKTTL